MEDVIIREKAEFVHLVDHVDELHLHFIERHVAALPGVCALAFAQGYEEVVSCLQSCWSRLPALNCGVTQGRYLELDASDYIYDCVVLANNSCRDILHLVQAKYNLRDAAGSTFPLLEVQCLLQF